MNVERYQQKIIKKYTKLIDESSGTFEEIFNINFSHNKYPIVEYSKDGEIVKISYPEMKNRIIAFSYQISKETDNIKDEFISINLENSPEWIVAFWAILMSGNKPYLLNLRHPKELSKKAIEDLHIRYSVDSEKGNDFGLKSLQISNNFIQIPSDYKYEFANEIAISTSATTMNEKVCFYRGQEILAQLSNTKNVLTKTKMVRKTYHETIKLLAFLPFYHIFGLITVYFWFTFFGYTIVLLNDYSSQTILSTIKKHEVTHIFSVPLFWHTIEDEVLRQLSLKDEKTQKQFKEGVETSLKLQTKMPRLGLHLIKKPFKEIRDSLFGNSVQLCISGGSYLRTSTLKFFNAIGYPLCVGYGASEIGITSFELSSNVKDRIRNSVGYPLTSVKYKIDENNVLFVKGKSTCHEMMINGKRITIDEWYNTMDIVHQDETGRYYIDGRQSDIIIGDNGENINPDVIEERFNFSKYPVNNFSVLGYKEEEKETVSIVIELKDSVNELEIEEIKKHVSSINDSLESMSKIKQILFTTDQIKNPNAIKVSRKYLLAHIKSGDIKLFKDLKAKAEVQEYDELTSNLIALFAEALRMNKDKIRPDSHFLYDLNGTSLDYFNLLAMINEKYHLDLAFDIDNPLVNVNDFKKYIEEHTK